MRWQCQHGEFWLPPLVLSNNAGQILVRMPLAPILACAATRTRRDDPPRIRAVNSSRRLFKRDQAALPLACFSQSLCGTRQVTAGPPREKRGKAGFNNSGNQHHDHRS
jgi:hypothetical protein